MKELAIEVYNETKDYIFRRYPEIQIKRMTIENGSNYHIVVCYYINDSCFKDVEYSFDGYNYTIEFKEFNGCEV